MGMLIDGHWHHEDNIIKQGAFVREPSVHNEQCVDDIANAIIASPGRFHLIGSWTCPWSHRTLLLRQFKQLATHIPLHITGGTRLEGYPANYGQSWTVPGSNTAPDNDASNKGACNKGVEIVHLHQLYTLDNPSYTGRSTVPILWDSQRQKIISNESSNIMQILDRVPGHQAADFTLVPEHLEQDIIKLNERIYHQLSNGTYRAGFATSQAAYDEAVDSVFGMLAELEQRLSTRRFLFGEWLTDADWRLFPTLVRFDLDYFIHSRCSRRRLVEYPNLWAYARDLYTQPGIASTVNFDAIHRSNYPDTHILPVAPEANWQQPHNRHRLGKISLAKRPASEA